MAVPNMPKFENVVVDDIITDMQGCSTPVNEVEPKPTSFVQTEHNLCHIVILAIRIERTCPGINILGKMAVMLSNLCRKDVKDETVEQGRLSR